LGAFAEAARAGGFAGVWPWSWKADDVHGGLDGARVASVRAAFDT
jgi:hypothetical protein